MVKRLKFRTKVYVSLLVMAAIAAATVNYRYYQRTVNAIPGYVTLPGAKENDYVKVFSYIYEHDFWNGGSGPGSDPSNAGRYIALLQEYFNDPRFNTIVDLGCGDWQIMRNISIPINKSYLGFDVVPSIVEANRAEFTTDNVHFYHTKSLREFVDLNVSGDLLVIKDVMQHWPHDEIQYFLENVLPRFKYALITNQYDTTKLHHNKAVVLGPEHSLGLIDPPYNLQAALVLEYDGPDHKQVLFYTNPNLA